MEVGISNNKCRPNTDMSNSGHYRFLGYFFKFSYRLCPLTPSHAAFFPTHPTNTPHGLELGQTASRTSAQLCSV